NFFTATQRLMNILPHEKLSAIALSIGPGMFTSLRVGLSLAKGLFLSQNIPLYGVNTLQAIAKSFFPLNLTNENSIICTPIMEAFQGEFFVAFYDQNGRIGDDLLITAEGYIDYIDRNFDKNKTIIAIGPGVLTFKKDAVIRKNSSKRKRLILIDNDLFFPSAPKIVRTALPRIKEKKCEAPDLLEPYYIKKTSAETKAGSQ
ncbi:MAG: tRNA (adenosine(37)-N6)-threonylcarbamoyltransferase complex dimerization subunit type 1 TsaB, partial [candidate division WOR-3 bacterium]